MTRETLFVSRNVNNHSHYKKRALELGFKNVTVTEAEKDGLNMIINDLKPKLVVMGSRFYECATPYMLSILHRRYPKIILAAVSLESYPAHLVMGLIANGVESYVNFSDGIDQFYVGLNLIKEGRRYISPEMEKKMKTKELPRASQELTERQIEVLRLLCNGFTTLEIADALHLSVRTVKFHKSELYNNLKVRNENELIRVALYLGFIKKDELDFYGGKYEQMKKEKGKEKKGSIGRSA